MRLLAVDTSTSHLAVALLEGDELLASLVQRVFRGHAACLLPAIDAVLAAAATRKEELEVLAVCRGPGSFSGLRIGLAGLAGLAAALELPLLGFVSLDLLALQFAAGWRGTICPVIDARKGQVYWAAYEAGKGDAPCRRLCDYRVDDPEEIFSGRAAAATLVVGSGVDACRETLGAAGEVGGLVGLPRALPNLALVPRLLAGPLADLPVERGGPVMPLYVRPADAEVKLAARLAAPGERENS